jgi:DNA-directed RNA polymerase specialized sigma24 family protein
MTAREYLSEAKRIKIRIEAMSEQLAFLRSTAEHIAPQLSDMPKPPINIHKGEDAIIRVLAFEERLKIQFTKLDEITATINEVTEPTLQVVLTKRYIGGKTWAEIARETYICERHIRRLHKQALDEVDILLKHVR